MRNSGAAEWIQRPTAIIVGSNQATFGAIQAIQAANLRIPDDISLIGADDKVFTDLLTPPLSVIWRDMAEVGRAAAAPARQGLVAIPVRHAASQGSELILRASCGPPAAATQRGTGLAGGVTAPSVPDEIPAQGAFSNASASIPFGVCHHDPYTARSVQLYETIKGSARPSLARRRYSARRLSSSPLTPTW